MKMFEVNHFSLSLLSAFAVPLAGRSASGDDGNNFAMMSMFMILAVILYLFRPNSLRRQRNVDEKQPLSSGQVWCRLELLVRSTVISSLVVYMTNQPSI